MLYKVGDKIRLGDKSHMRNSNLPDDFAGMVVEICEVNSYKYFFYTRSSRWYVYHGDCEPYFEMPDKYDLMEFITGDQL